MTVENNSDDSVNEIERAHFFINEQSFKNVGGVEESESIEENHCMCHDGCRHFVCDGTLCRAPFGEELDDANVIGGI